MAQTPKIILEKPIRIYAGPPVHGTHVPGLHVGGKSRAAKTGCANSLKLNFIRNRLENLFAHTTVTMQQGPDVIQPPQLLRRRAVICRTHNRDAKIPEEHIRAIASCCTVQRKLQSLFSDDEILAARKRDEVISFRLQYSKTRRICQHVATTHLPPQPVNVHCTTLRKYQHNDKARCPGVSSATNTRATKNLNGIISSPNTMSNQNVNFMREFLAHSVTIFKTEQN